MQLAQPALSYLMDHVVAGRCLLPGAAMFEGAAAAGATLAEAAGPGLCLTGISIPAPVVMQAGRLQTLMCTVDNAQGGVQLQQSSPAMPGMCSRPVVNSSYSRLKTELLHAAGTISPSVYEVETDDLQLCCRCKVLP